MSTTTAHQPASPSHDRGHGRPPHRREDAKRLHPPRQELHCSSAARPTRRQRRICARFQVHEREQGVQPPTMNSTVSALRFFFTTTLGRPEMARHLRLVKQPRKLPRARPG